MDIQNNALSFFSQSSQRNNTILSSNFDNNSPGVNKYDEFRFGDNQFRASSPNPYQFTKEAQFRSNVAVESLISHVFGKYPASSAAHPGTSGVKLAEYSIAMIRDGNISPDDLARFLTRLFDRVADIYTGPAGLDMGAAAAGIPSFGLKTNFQTFISTFTTYLSKAFADTMYPNLNAPQQDLADTYNDLRRVGAQPFNLQSFIGKNNNPLKKELGEKALKPYIEQYKRNNNGESPTNLTIAEYLEATFLQERRDYDFELESNIESQVSDALIAAHEEGNLALQSVKGIAENVIKAVQAKVDSYTTLADAQYKKGTDLQKSLAETFTKPKESNG